MISPFKTFLETITDIQSYVVLTSRSFLSSLGYYLFFTLALSLSLAIYTNQVHVPKIYDFINTSSQKIINAYPDNLTLKLDQNLLSVGGQKEPLILPIDSTIPLPSRIQNLLVIDTATTASYIFSYKTAILLTQSEMVIQSSPDSDQYQLLAYKELEVSGTLTKDIFVKGITAIHNLSKSFRPYLIILIAIFIFIGLSISRFIYLLINTLLITVAGLLLGKNLGYKRFLKMGLYAIIPAQLIQFISILLYKNPPAFLFDLTFFGILLLATLTIPVIRTTKL